MGAHMVRRGGGRWWQLLPRSEEQDGANGTEGFVAVPWNVTSMDECKWACLNTSACRGIEYSSKLQRCEVWVQPVEGSAAASDVTCLHFTPSGPPLNTCPESWSKLSQEDAWCSKAGENCLVTGCCEDPMMTCFTQTPKWAECRAI